MIIIIRWDMEPPWSYQQFCRVGLMFYQENKEFFPNVSIPPCKIRLHVELQVIIQWLTHHIISPNMNLPYSYNRSHLNFNNSINLVIKCTSIIIFIIHSLSTYKKTKRFKFSPLFFWRLQFFFHVYMKSYNFCRWSIWTSWIL